METLNYIWNSIGDLIVLNRHFLLASNSVNNFQNSTNEAKCFYVHIKAKHPLICSYGLIDSVLSFSVLSKLEPTWIAVLRENSKLIVLERNK